MKKLATTLGLALLVAAVAVWWLSSESPAPGPYNLVLITLDTTRADRLGCYGHGQAVTPALDGLAAAGAQFDQALCTVPLTLPSHATILTGLFPPEHGLKINGTKRLASGLTTLAERLKSADYQTAAFVAAFALDSRFGLDQGFDLYDDDLSTAYEQGLRDANSVYRAGNHVTDAALNWLVHHRQRPFFCWVHLYDPHKPYHAHDALADTRFRGQPSYDGEIAFMDRQVARLRDFLDRHHLTDRTLVVAVGDHGEGLGQHGEAEHGYMLYDTTLRVPLLLSLPGLIPAGLRVEDPVSLVDLLPTVLDLLGLPPQEDRRGRSLVAVLHGGDLQPEPCYAETDLPYAYFGWGPQRSLITDPWKYVRSPRAELYDRRTDPDETRNLAEQEPDRVADLDAVLADMESAMHPHQAEAVTLDAEQVNRLQALGYVGGGRDVDAQNLDLANLKDIKDMLPVIDRMWHMFELVEHGSLADAERLCREMVEQSPESPRLQCYLADVLSEQKRFHEAIPHYVEALRLDPRYTEAYVNVGLALGRTGQHEKAALHLEQAVAFDPHKAEAHYNLGIAYMRQNKNADAISRFAEALRLRPVYRDARLNLALLLARDGNYAEALEHLRTAAENTPRDPVILYNLGAVLARLERYAEAEGAYRKSIEIRPNAAGTHNNLGIALAHQGKIADALAEYREALRLDPDHVGAMSNLAWTLATNPRDDLRNGAEALTWARKATAAQSEPSFRSLDVLAAALAESGDFDQAVSTLQQAISIARRNAQGTDLTELEQRIGLYKAERPFRQSPPGNASVRKTDHGQTP